MAVQAVPGGGDGGRATRTVARRERSAVGSAPHARPVGVGIGARGKARREARGQGRGKACREEGVRTSEGQGRSQTGAAGTMTPVTMYYNSKCGTCRKTLDRIREKGIEPTIVEYLKDPPSAAELEKLLGLLGMEPRDLMRTTEPLYTERGLDSPALTRRQLVQAMVAYPIVIQRPIVVAGEKAVVARPPERVDEIL